MIYWQITSYILSIIEGDGLGWLDQDQSATQVDPSVPWALRRDRERVLEKKIRSGSIGEVPGFLDGGRDQVHPA